MAKVDVVVPCYNYGRFLDTCVSSVLSQSMNDVRVLIIDDASSDNSALVAQRLASSDSRVTVRIHEKNQGHIKTYNEGIEWTDSDYFLLLSADDLLVEGALSRATTIMDANPDIVLTHGQAAVWPIHSPIPRISAQLDFAWDRHDVIQEMCATGGNVVDTPTVVCRTNAQRAIGGYRVSLPHSGDMEMWLRFGAHGTVARIQAVQAIYRRHSSNMSDIYYRADWGDYWHRKSAFDFFFKELGGNLPQQKLLKELASHSLGEHAFKCGTQLVRKGIKEFRYKHVNHGTQLLKLSFELNSRLRYPDLFKELFRWPKSVTGDQPTSRITC